MNGQTIAASKAGRILTGRGRWMILAVIAVITAGIAVPLLSQYRAPRARQYLNVSACLLTDPDGVVPGTPAAPAWSAMQSASLRTRVMVSYLSDTGPTDVAAMLSALAQRKCGLIITTAAAAGQAVSAAGTYPHQQFLIIASSAAAVPRNAAVVSPAAAPARIAQAIRDLSAQA